MGQSWIVEARHMTYLRRLQSATIADPCMQLTRHALKHRTPLFVPEAVTTSDERWSWMICALQQEASVSFFAYILKHASISDCKLRLMIHISGAFDRSGTCKETPSNIDNFPSMEKHILVTNDEQLIPVRGACLYQKSSSIVDRVWRVLSHVYTPWGLWLIQQQPIGEHLHLCFRYSFQLERHTGRGVCKVMYVVMSNVYMCFS